MLHRRIYQFLMIYSIGFAALMLTKYSLNLSDYVIPGLSEIGRTCRRYFGLYLLAVLNTLSVAILGHILSICMATVVGIIGRLTIWIGSVMILLLFICCVLSWLIAPDSVLENNRTAILTQQTLEGVFKPATVPLSVVLPNEGQIEHPDKNGFYIDFTPWVLVILISIATAALSWIHGKLSDLANP